MIQLFNGDCLEEYKKIEPGSVDLILCDPPYGTITAFGESDIKHGLAGKTSWDIAINPEDIFRMANEVLRMNGKMILFSQEPYTSRLIQSSFENMNFCYRMIWEKDHFANGLLAKKAPVSFYEDILVFYKPCKKYDYKNVNPLRKYFSLVMEYIGKTNTEIGKVLGHQKANHCFRVDSSQFGLCTEETYLELIEVFNIDDMNGFLEYSDLFLTNQEVKKEISEKLNYLFPSTFNLPPNHKYKSNILKYSKPYQGLHPTQKPVLLLEDLIQTYSNPEELILDFTMGSGSTGEACWNTKRRFIGIEKNLEYFNIAKARLEEHQKQLRLF